MNKFLLVALLIMNPVAAHADQRALLEKHADRMAEKYGVDPVLLKSTCHIESGWRGGISDKGARGICQLLPNTVHTQSCANCYRTEADAAAALDNPWKNIELAAIHLRWLHKILGDDDSLIRAAYYAGTANDIVLYVIKGKAAAVIYTPISVEY